MVRKKLSKLFGGRKKHQLCCILIVHADNARIIKTIPATEIIDFY